MLKHRTFIFLIPSLLTVFLVSSAVAQRGIVPVPIKNPQGEQVLLYKESYALVVGVSAYEKGWPTLPGVLKDVELVKYALEEKDFHVITVINPSFDELRNAIEKFIHRYGQQEDNRLLFYFAGHGHTLKLSYGDEMGYFVPVNAPNPNKDQSGFLAKSLNMESIEVFAKQIQAKHALFLFDSCFSGSIFALNRAAIPANISYKTSEPVRQFVTAGSANETVPDESIFRDQFIRAIRGEGDSDGDGYVTGVELGEFLQKTVVNYSKGSQHPQYGKIRNPNLDKGDFIFSLLDRNHIEQSIDSIVKEREKLEQKRLNLEEERKRKAVLQRRMREEKKKLEEERQKMEAERERVAKIQPSKEQKNRERIPFGNDGLDSILNSIKNKEEIRKKKDVIRREKEKIAYKEFIKFNENLEGGLRSINEDLRSKNKLLINLKLDINKYNEIVGSDFGEELKPQAWMELVKKYSEKTKGATFNYSVQTPKWSSNKSQAWRQSITSLSNQLIKNIPPGSKPTLGVMPFKDLRYDRTTPFSRILSEDIKTILANAEDLKLKEIKISKDQKPGEIAEANSLDYYVSGSYRMERIGLEVQSRLINARTKNIQSSADILIERKELNPDDLALIDTMSEEFKSALETGQSKGDTSGLLFALKSKIANLENRRNLKRKELESKLINKFGVGVITSIYKDKVNSLLQQKLIDAPKGPLARTIVVSFSIIPNGKIKELKLNQKTGYDDCDELILSDVARSGPFPAFPDELMSPIVNIEFVLRMLLSRCGY